MEKFCIITIIIIIFSQVQFFFNNLATSIKEATLLSIFNNLLRVHFSHQFFLLISLTHTLQQLCCGSKFTLGLTFSNRFKFLNQFFYQLSEKGPFFFGVWLKIRGWLFGEFLKRISCYPKISFFSILLHRTNHASLLVLSFPS